ncbi:hypothetical protein [Halegenticoccus soli]|uniref:hypothetical protein n=1 Tax=Halegenticoccus soli TaxID=1985678 RepID=UPI000C6E1B78|nr:hypothetical protein [Halegenticoccus soli]
MELDRAGTTKRRTVLRLLGGAGILGGCGALASVPATAGAGSPPSAPSVEWTVRFEDDPRAYELNELSERSQAIVPTEDGGYLLATDGKQISETGPSEDTYAVLVKASSDGERERVRFVEGTSMNPSVEGVVRAHDGGYLLVGSARDFSTDANREDVEREGEDQVGERATVPETAQALKVDAEGNLQWEKLVVEPQIRRDDSRHEHELVSTASFETAIRTDDGGYLLGGAKGVQGWLLKLAGDGTTEWERLYESLPADDGVSGRPIRSVIRTRDGGYAFVYVDTVVKVDSEGTVLWERELDDVRALSQILETPSGELAVVAQDNPVRSDGKTRTHFTLVKLAPDGTIVGIAKHNGPYKGIDRAYSAVLTPDGGYLLAGEMMEAYTGAKRLAFLKLDADGKKDWQLLVPETDGHDSGSALIRTADGGVAATLSYPGIVKLEPLPSGSEEDPTGESGKADGNEEGERGEENETNEQSAANEESEAKDGGEAGEETSADAPTETDSPTETPEGTSTPTMTATDTTPEPTGAASEGTSPSDETTSEDGPGFGLFAGLSGLAGTGGYYLLRRRSAREKEE